VATTLSGQANAARMALWADTRTAFPPARSPDARRCRYTMNVPWESWSQGDATGLLALFNQAGSGAG
jgi:hypothetical protein